MSEWWTYRPEDFLLFSPRVYWRMFELHNAALWPLPALCLALGAGLLWLAWRRQPGAGPWIAAALAWLWTFVGWAFVWNRYAPINWAAAYVAPLFALQALLLASSAVLGSGLAPVRRGIVGGFGVFLLAFALVGYPLLAPLMGRPWMGAEVFGIAPDPTAIGTLGLLLLAGRSPLLPWLFPVPVLWCLMSGATLLTMGAPEAWVPLAAAAAATGLAAWARRGA
jgi:hypothetical protein